MPVAVVVVKRDEHAGRRRAVASLGDRLAVSEGNPERFDELPVFGVIGCVCQWPTAYGKIDVTTSITLFWISRSSVRPQTTATSQARRAEIPRSISLPA